jgi:hypothetical protein
MTNEITKLDLQGDTVTATIRGEFEVKIPRGNVERGFLLSEAKVVIDPALFSEAVDFNVAKLVEDISHWDEGGIDIEGVTVLAERTYHQRGNIYRFRDVKGAYRPRSILPFKDFSPECEYATKDEDGKTVWQSCAEGVPLDDIEPFEAIAA